MTQHDLMEIQEKNGVIPAGHNDVSAIMQVIERVAVNPDVDIDKMQRLMDLQERILDRNAQQAFAQDYARMRPELPMVIRTKRNEHTRSNYAPLEEINKTVDPVLAKHGFATMCQVVAQTDRDVTVKAILMHRDGWREETTLTYGIDKAGVGGKINKTDIHATASAITYAKRGALCALLNISTGDDDGNAAESKPISKVRAEVLTEKLMQCASDVQDNFRKRYIKSEDVPEAQYDKVLAQLNKYIDEGNADDA